MKKTKKIVEIVDDFDGTPADQTVRFAFNGASYEIDLSREHFEEFAEAIQPYIKAGRKVGSTRRRGNAGNPTQRLENAKIRAWAKEEGLELSDRGRIPAPIVEAYQQGSRLIHDGNCGRTERCARNSLYAGEGWHALCVPPLRCVGCQSLETTLFVPESLPT